MLCHVVVFTWKDGFTAEQVSEVRDAFDRIAAEVEELVSFRHGPDLQIREGNGDYALVANFRDEDGWRRYQAHPLHKALVKDIVAPLAAHRVAIQFTV